MCLGIWKVDGLYDMRNRPMFNSILQSSPLTEFETHLGQVIKANELKIMSKIISVWVKFLEYRSLQAKRRAEVRNRHIGLTSLVGLRSMLFAIEGPASIWGVKASAGAAWGWAGWSKSIRPSPTVILKMRVTGVAGPFAFCASRRLESG